MARTVRGAFTELLQRQGLTENQKGIASARHADLRQYFQNHFEMAEPVFSVGSYARNTMTSGEIDIDFMAIMHPYGASKYWERYSKDSSRFLYMVRDTLNTSYPRTKVSSRQVCVKLDFTQIVTDITPGVPAKGGGYLIPNGKGGWQTTNPPFHQQFIDKANHSKNGRLKQMIRLMKYWNQRNDHLLTSFHTELLTEFTFRSGVVAESVSYAMKEGLRVIGTRLSDGVPDPWKGGNGVDSYLSLDDKSAFLQMISSDAHTAALAVDLENAGRVAEAFDQWNIVFRQGFPKFG